MRKTVIFISAISLLSFVLNAQQVEKKFGRVYAKDFQFPTGIEDSTAGAVYLLEEGLSTYDYNFDVVFTYHARILILNSSEFDMAEIEIPYPEKGYVKDIEASAFNLVSGKIQESKLSRRDVYKDKLIDETNKQVFTIPNVKEGSIIEYTYTVSQGSFRRLNTWYFQKDVPVVYSEYKVEMPDFFNYKQTMTGSLRVSSFEPYRNNRQLGSEYISVDGKKFTMRNIPAFVEEPFMKSRKDNISSVRFEMVFYQFPGEMLVRVAPSNYFHMSRALAKTPYFESIYNRNNYYNDVLEKITAGLTDSLEMAMAVYKYVQDEFEIDADMLTSNFRSIFKEKKGWAQDINMVLAGMLYNLDFGVNLVRLSTKDNGVPNPFYASVVNFDYTICLLSVGGQDYLLDAAPDYLPFGNLKPSTVNDKGLVIDEHKPRWITLPYGDKSTLKCSAELTIDDKGALSGKIDLHREGYSAFNFKNRYFPNTIDLYKEDLGESKPSWIIDKHEVEVDDFRVKENLLFSTEPESDESLKDIFIKPVFYQRTTENPFKLDTRKYSISLVEPVYEALVYNIAIPDGYEVVSLPDNISIRLPGNKSSYFYSCASSGNSITLTSLFKINETEFSIDEYLFIKEFWAQVVEKQSEEFHLRKTIN